MFATCWSALVAAAVIFTRQAVAQEQYTVWGSVIFSRTGERTPRVLGDLPTTLTSFGAQQQYEVGQFYRRRYVESAFSTNYSTTGIDSAPIQGLAADQLSVIQLYFSALEFQYSVASAQAFVQGLYPPFELVSNHSLLATLDPTSILANGSYIIAPLSGYQYPYIHTPGFNDPDYIYLGGDLGCDASDTYGAQYPSTPEFQATESSSKSLYLEVCAPLLPDLDPDQYDYLNAWAIYDYLNYQYMHNTSVADFLDVDNRIGQLQWLSDQQQWAQLGNVSAKNTLTGVEMPSVITGSISTIAGNMMAYGMLYQLQQNIASAGEYYKLSVMFGDFEPLVSFFAVAGLTDANNEFKGMPNFASTAVLELFSIKEVSESAAYPSPEDLYVRFYFMNGTDPESFQGYSILGNGPDGFTMRWDDFQNNMWSIALGDPTDWCSQCGSNTLFCAAFNSTDSDSSYSSAHGHRHAVSPAVAGVIGAIVSLVVAGMILLLVMLFGGLRMHRVAPRSSRSDLGGFKGGQKMRSDQDLVLPKDGAAITTTTADASSPDQVGHERIGSWELKQAEAGAGGATAATATGTATAKGGRGPRKASFEDDEDDEMRRNWNPFGDPVKPDERV